MPKRTKKAKHPKKTAAKKRTKPAAKKRAKVKRAPTLARALMTECSHPHPEKLIEGTSNAWCGHCGAIHWSGHWRRCSLDHRARK